MLKGTVDVVGILVGVGSGSYVQDIDTLVGALGVSGLSL